MERDLSYEMADFEAPPTPAPLLKVALYTASVLALFWGAKNNPQ